MNLCIYGASSTSLDASYLEKGEEFGRKMASRGHHLVFGAGANGMMGAVCRGCAEHGVDIIGVVPHYFTGDGRLYDGCTELIQTDTMRQRKAILQERADGYVVLPGGVGTFDEFFELLTLRQLGRLAKPIVIYNINGYFDATFAMLRQAVEQKFMKAGTCELYFVSNDPDEILDYLESFRPDNVDAKAVKYI